ncbi:MAG: hypothetical protein ACTSQ1_11740, partial [Promethearchaeota archaeon]
DVVDRIDNKLYSLQEQIDSLETRFSTYEKKVTKNKINPISPPPSPSPTPTIKKENSENPRRAVMNELRYLLEKRKQNINKNQK